MMLVKTSDIKTPMPGLGIMLDFLAYLNMFYGPDSIYPLTKESGEGLTANDVVIATGIHLSKEDCPPFEGDTFDRESVANILIEELGYKYPDNE